MGGLLLWLHLDCPGMAWQHAEIWTEVLLPYDLREGIREVFEDWGDLGLQFGAERPL